MKRVRKGVLWLLCVVMFTVASACTVEKGASGQNAGVPTVRQENAHLTHGTRREKLETVGEGAADDVVVENNYLSVSEKTEREQAQQTINNLREKDIASYKKVMDACGNGNAGSAACAGARLEVIAARGEYENTGNYNSKASQHYAYGQIVNLLNITSVDAQNQQQVKDAMVQLGVDKATAEQYVSTYEGMQIVAASMTPVIGSAAASKIETLAGKQRLSSNFEISSCRMLTGRVILQRLKVMQKYQLIRLNCICVARHLATLSLCRKNIIL